MLLVFIFLILLIIIIFNMKIKLFVKTKHGKLNAIFKIYIVNLPIWTIKLNDIKKKKSKKKERRKEEFIKKIKSNKKAFFKTIYNIMNEYTFNLESLKLRIDISTTDPVLTSYITMITSNIITFALKASKLKIDYKNCRYKIHSLYIDKKVLNIKLNCIISANLVHIIYIVYRNYKKWRCDIDGRRASNRKPYGNCNEQYKANDRC